jgi:hypothetical protein
MPRVRNLVLRNSPEQRIRSVSAAYTLTMGDDDILLVNSTAASRTITLPALADAYDAQLGVGKTFYIQKITAANSVIIEGDGAETINGSANQTLGSQFAAVKLVAGPSEWTMLSSGSISTADLADNAVTNAKMADDAVDSAEIADGAIDLVHMSAESVDSDQYVDGSIDVEHLSTGCVTPVKILATLVNPAADAACAILNTTTEINVSVTGAGNVAISTTSSVAGQRHPDAQLDRRDCAHQAQLCKHRLARPVFVDQRSWWRTRDDRVSDASRGSRDRVRRRGAEPRSCPSVARVIGHGLRRRPDRT